MPYVYILYASRVNKNIRRYAPSVIFFPRFISKLIFNPFPLLSFLLFCQDLIDLLYQVVILELSLQIFIHLINHFAHHCLICALSGSLDCLLFQVVVSARKLPEAARNILIVLDQLFEY